MKLSQNKPFHAYLKKQGIVVKNSQIPIDKAEQIPVLYHNFGVEKAKKVGLPKQFREQADKVITISLDYLNRADQTPEKYDVKIVESAKDYESGTWEGRFEGTISNLWKWLMDECAHNHNDDDFVEAIEQGLEDIEE